MKNSLDPLSFVLPAVLLALTTGCHRRETTAPAVTPDVSVVEVRQTSVPVSTELPGRTAPYLVAQVRARVSGIVQKRAFQEGADVAADQVLFQIDPAPYRAALNGARAQLDRARANVEATSAQAQRDAVLVAANVVSKQAYVNAVAAQRQAAADVNAARAAQEIAELNLGYTQVSSPITGRIGAALVTQGAYVQGDTATLMATVQQIDPIYVDLTQTSVEGLQLRQQMVAGKRNADTGDAPCVRLVLEDNTEYASCGSLEFTDITVDPGTGSVRVRALFPNPKHVLLPGMFVRARLDQGSVRAFLVPQDGVTHDRAGNATVLTVGDDDKVTARQVLATRVFGDQWIVESGLREGDRVIVRGSQQVQPGAAVHASVLPASSPKLVDVSTR